MSFTWNKFSFDRGQVQRIRAFQLLSMGGCWYLPYMQEEWMGVANSLSGDVQPHNKVRYMYIVALVIYLDCSISAHNQQTKSVIFLIQNGGRWIVSSFALLWYSFLCLQSSKNYSSLKHTTPHVALILLDLKAAAALLTAAVAQHQQYCMHMG